MLSFRQSEKKESLIMLHYAQRMNNAFIVSLLAEKKSVETPEEANQLVSFFWAMLDASIDDNKSKVVVLEEIDLQRWINRLFHIISDYLICQGYAECWNAVDEATK